MNRIVSEWKWAACLSFVVSCIFDLAGTDLRSLDFRRFRRRCSRSGWSWCCFRCNSSSLTSFWEPNVDFFSYSFVDVVAAAVQVARLDQAVNDVI